MERGTYSDTSEMISDYLNEMDKNADPAEARAAADAEKPIRDAMFTLKQASQLPDDLRTSMEGLALSRAFEARHDYKYQERLKSDPLLRGVLRIIQRSNEDQQHGGQSVRAVNMMGIEKIAENCDPGNFNFGVKTRSTDRAGLMQYSGHKAWAKKRSPEFVVSLPDSVELDDDQLFRFTVNFLGAAGNADYNTAMLPEWAINILKEEGVPVDDLKKEARSLMIKNGWEGID